MADISQYLQDILDAVYGEDVRGSIHDAIELINEVGEVVLTTGTAVTGATSSSTGFYDDSLYLNTNTMELWKCTGTDSWASQGTLKGPQGNPGTNGTNGTNGADGNGISSITKTGTVGLVDTYTISYTDGTTSTFTVTNGQNGTNGADGEDGNKWYRGTAISGKSVNPTIFSGSGITEANPNDFYLNSTEGAVYYCVTGGDADTATWAYDFTMTGGGGGGSTPEWADVLNKPFASVDTTGVLDITSNVLSADMSGYVESSDLATVATTGAYSDLSGKPSLATVATSGSYTDLSDKPTIPTVDQVYDGTSANAQSGVAVASAISGKANSSDLATVATSGSYADLTNKPTIPTVDQTYDATSTNAQSGVAVASAISGVTAPSWSNVTSKPFSSVDTTGVLDITSDTLSADMSGYVAYEKYPSSGSSSVNVSTAGTRSIVFPWSASSNVHYDLWINIPDGYNAAPPTITNIQLSGTTLTYTVNFPVAGLYSYKWVYGTY